MKLNCKPLFENKTIHLEHFANMADIESFHQGEAVGFRDKICLIRSIDHSQLGFNVYHLEDVLSDQVFVGYKHQLCKAATVNLEDLAIDLAVETEEMEFELTKTITAVTEQHDKPEEVGDVAPDLSGTGLPLAPADIPIATPTATPTVGRFTSMTEDEIDDLVNARMAKNTNHQTKWGIKIFRGKQKNDTELRQVYSWCHKLLILCYPPIQDFKNGC